MGSDGVVSQAIGLPSWAWPSRGCLQTMVRRATGSYSAVVIDWRLEAVPHRITAFTTACLYRAFGTAMDGDDEIRWSLFVKHLRSLGRAPGFDELPLTQQEQTARLVPWRYEAEIYQSSLRDALPPGLRVPVLLWIAATDDELVIWLEDIHPATVDWDPPRFASAARLLGRLDARLTIGDLLPSSASRQPGLFYRTVAEWPIQAVVIPALGTARVWNHPLIRGKDPRLETDLQRLARQLPALLDELEELPQVMSHGDSCPQNLLAPADDPLEFVVIDWTAGGMMAVGADLSQLAVGLVHEDVLEPEELPALSELILQSYMEGLAADGLKVEPAAVQRGFEANLVLRSAFMAIPIERLEEPQNDELAAHIDRRLRLTRYLVEVGFAGR